MNFLWGQKNVIIPNEIQSKPVGKKNGKDKKYFIDLHIK